MLGSVAAVSAPGLVARVVTLLQDELLPLELWVLVTHPAGRERTRRERMSHGCCFWGDCSATATVCRRHGERARGNNSRLRLLSLEALNKH